MKQTWPDLPPACFTWSAPNCVALDEACELIIGDDSHKFCSAWENGMHDQFQNHLTGLEECLYKRSVRRQEKFISEWAVALIRLRR